MKHILFVDDEQYVLNGLSRLLHPMRPEWRMIFVTSGSKALELMELTHFDVLVTDMRMPGLNGSQLLAEVSNRYPQVIRLVLSGMCDREAALSSVAGAHQFLAKPCDAGLLKLAVERALTVQENLANGALKGFVSHLISLPSLPSIYYDLLDAAQDSSVTARRLGQILSRDVAMTSKVLQIANSPLFGIRRRVLSAADACVFLGSDTIQALVLSLGVFSQFHPKGQFSAEDLQVHSLETASLARRIAIMERLSKDITEECFLGGMLHDVGKLLMAVNCPDEYDRCLGAVAGDAKSLAQIESEIFGITHADAGMYLLRLWGLPEAVTAAVALHHRPAQSPERNLNAVPIVHAANVLVRDAQSQFGLDEPYLGAIIGPSRVEKWRTLPRAVADETL